MKTNFIVAGGGIGGLATALGIARTGKTVRLLEKATEFGEVGAGIQLAPNALSVLDNLGVLEKVTKNAVYPKRLVLMDALSGEELTALPLGEEFQEKFGYPYVVIHRPDLLNALLEACQNEPNITLHNKKELQTFNNFPNSVEVTCQDGTTYVADALIGSDGIWSNTRKQIHLDEAVESQYVAYRGTVPTDQIAEANMDDVVMWIGPELHFVHYPVRRKELYNLVVVFKSDNFKADSDDWGTPDEIAKKFSSCHEDLRNILNYINLHRRWPMRDRDPIDNWTVGRTTLMGDAAHPMLQYLAQGACQAIEDAESLAKHIKENGEDIEGAFQAYQNERLPKTSKVQTTARFFGEVLHVSDPISRALRNRILRTRKDNDTSDVEWLYLKEKSKISN